MRASGDVGHLRGEILSWVDTSLKQNGMNRVLKELRHKLGRALDREPVYFLVSIFPNKDFLPGGFGLGLFANSLCLRGG